MRHHVVALGALLALSAGVLVVGCGGGQSSSATGSPLPMVQPTSATATDVAGPSEAESQQPPMNGGTGERSGCDLVSAEDWTLYGVDGAGPANAVSDGSGGWYCVYAGTSGATGGIEFDIFPMATEAEAEEVYRTALQEIPQGEPPPGAAFSESSFVEEGGVAYLAVRDGSLVMVFSAPSHADSALGLLSLAVVVGTRAAVSP